MTLDRTPSTTTGTETQYAMSVTNAYTDNGATVGQAYFYVVTAFGNCAESAVSGEVSATPLPPVPKPPPDSNKRCGCGTIGETRILWSMAALAALALLLVSGRLPRRVT